LGKNVDRVERITAWLGDVKAGVLRAEQVATSRAELLRSLAAKTVADTEAFRRVPMPSMTPMAWMGGHPGRTRAGAVGLERVVKWSGSGPWCREQRRTTMRKGSVLGGILILGLATVGVTFVVGMRRKTPFVLNAVRRSGRAMKPLVLRSAGQAGSPTAVVEHLGRTTGRRYDTPVVATPTDEGFVIALPYGQNTDWLKNVLSAGCATIRFEGASHDIDHPEVVEIQKVEDHFAPKERRQHRRFAVREALIVTTIRKVSNPSTGAPPAG